MLIYELSGFLACRYCKVIFCIIETTLGLQIPDFSGSYPPEYWFLATVYLYIDSVKRSFFHSTGSNSDIYFCWLDVRFVLLLATR
jgi:hypothetical protein